MSGAFETAAGAFAVVGVADVLIRTGRDLYRFLHDISDAPDEIVRLRDVIKEMIYLHEASVKCQNDLRARGAAVGNDTALRSLESASGALSRALQSLKLLVSKFKGAKTWSRVKFVLDESKVKKVISALEQAKVLLANALTLACCEFSALSNANIVTMVRASFDKAGVENKNLLESLETRLDAQFQNVLTTHGQNQKELLAKFDENQHQTLAKQASINQAIFSVQKMEMDNWKHQHTKMRQLGRDQKQTSASIQSLNQTVAKAADLDSLSALLKKSLSISHRARQSEQKGRYISFLGESPDQIMAYLLPFQDNINFAIDYAISQYRDEVSIDDAEWLRSEFEHLIGSASQELALQYRNSTATSLDHWSYPEDKVGVFKSAKRKRKGPLAWAPPTTLQHDDYHRPESLSRKCAKYSQQDILVPTARGEVTISLPNRRKPIKAPRGLDEVALYYTAEQIRSKFQIRARFLRDLQHARQPRICAHLNVFVEVENIIEVYVELMENGSLVEIDDALRKGTISPFHNDSGGYNFLLFTAAFHNRMDVLDYLETQGIGQSALNHDRSISLPLVVISQEEASLSEKAMSRAADSASFATQSALILISSSEDSKRHWHEISKALKTLQQEVFDQSENDTLLDCFAQRDLSQICISVPRLVSLLVEADPSSIDNRFGTACVLYLLWWGLNSHYNDEDKVEMLSTFVKRGVDMDLVGDGGNGTLSMFARARQTWNIWCEALQNSGKNIESVVSKEGNSWLLGDDWKEVWLQHEYDGYSDILSDESDSESSEKSDYEGSEEGDSDENEYDDSDENDHQPYNRRDRGDDNHTSREDNQ